jgi:hypothetical protein
MPDVFGVEGQGGAPKKKDPAKKKTASRGEPDVLHGSMKPGAGEVRAGRYVLYDNDSGEIQVQLPPRFAKYRRELEEDMLEEFMGEPSASADGQRSLEAWIKAWIEKKTEEDPDLAKPDDVDAG